MIPLWGETSPRSGGSVHFADLPPSRNGPGDGVYSFGITVTNGIGWNVFRELWPDMRRRFKNISCARPAGIRNPILAREPDGGVRRGPGGPPPHGLRTAISRVRLNNFHKWGDRDPAESAGIQIPT